MSFAESGFEDFEGYILIVMNVCSIRGSVFLGLVYERVVDDMTKRGVILITLVLMLGSFMAMGALEMVPENRWWYILLIGVIGLCLMGNYNITIIN